MKRTIITAFITAIATTAFCMTINHIHERNLYPCEMEVQDIEENTCTMLDFRGLLWQYDSEDLEVGDKVVVIIDYKGTPDYSDDEIISARYAG